MTAAITYGSYCVWGSNGSIEGVLQYIRSIATPASAIEEWARDALAAFYPGACIDTEELLSAESVHSQWIELIPIAIESCCAQGGYSDSGMKWLNEIKDRLRFIKTHGADPSAKQS